MRQWGAKVFEYIKIFLRLIPFTDCTDLESMSVNEKVARSVALEQAYVHDVYELFCDNPKSKPWPRVQQFLESLEPGSLVCDVGCGNGKYLNVNSTIYNMGGDKCIRLSEIAREKDNEVFYPFTQCICIAPKII